MQLARLELTRTQVVIVIGMRFGIAVIAALASSSDAVSLAAPAQQTSAVKALTLRGGALPGASLSAATPAASSSSRKATYVLGANALVSTAYGILSTVSPNAMLGIYGVTTKLDFMSPAYGVCQYLGGMHIVVALRCFCALGFRGFPARDQKETLNAMCTLHTVAGLVAGFRQARAAHCSLKWFARLHACG